MAILPPFEGFDETAHYSSVVQVADSGTIPVQGQAFIAREVLDYQGRGPRPYASTPPFDSNGGLTYGRFFAAGGDRAAAWQPSPPFSPSQTRNWQAQHPPLYYLTMAPLATLTADQSLAFRLLVLRLGSLALAVSGLAVAAFANERLMHGAGLVTVLFPLAVPGWFPEMGRMGNDSLAGLLASLAWLAICSIFAGDERRRWWVAAGVALGLGCLTKGFMVPVSLGCLALLAWRSGRSGRLVLSLVPTAALGAPWYLWQIVQGLPPTNDSLVFAQAGGVATAFAQDGAIIDYLGRLGAIGKTFIWGGTWSFIRLPGWMHAAFLVPMLALVWGWGRAVRTARFPALLPLVAIVPMLAGLAYHALMWQTVGPQRVTGGWYLHVLAGPFGLLMAVALRGLADFRWSPAVAKAGMAHSAAFLVLATGLQVGINAGCSQRLGDQRDILIDWGCAADPALIFSRLSVLSYPILALCALTVALAACIWGTAARR